MSEKKTFTNHLIHESSPYLLQHAHNPVEWYAWNEEAWAKAKKENKLVIISIGYSSCHWCHVMEHESFEDTTVANIMNENFICIKVDREERPDVDQIYMAAVQLMTGRGGWPLNCITLPDKRPVYGGTYFPKQQWTNVLQQLADYYKENEKDAEEYAEKVKDGIHQMELIKLNNSPYDFSFKLTEQFADSWKNQFDTIEGGMSRAPKFPMPNNYEFLLRYYAASKDEQIKKQVLLTLDKMAYGGIYDQLGGGFARYSTDSLWKAPHFEKMLYDNAQLVSLYSIAFQLTKNDLYKDVVYETLDFIHRELTEPDGGFYSALDADSEGEEGKFYVWTKSELEKILSNYYSLFAEYYNINETGFWESGNYILLRKESASTIAQKFNLSVAELNNQISASKKLLLAERNKRVRPGLDDKELTSWNALMLKAYCDAYNAFGEEKFKDAALKNANRNWSRYWRGAALGYSHSYKKDKGTLNGFLEDYSFSAEAFIALYQITFDETWLNRAKEISDYALQHFFDSQSGMFFFASDNNKELIARKMEVNDNVIPASNSSMAKVLYYLSIYFDDYNYATISDVMLNNIKGDIIKYPSGYSNWGILLLHKTSPYNEIVIAGKNAIELRNGLSKNFLPNSLLAGSTVNSSSLGLLENRFQEEKSLIYVCENKTCQLPVENVPAALSLLNK